MRRQSSVAAALAAGATTSVALVLLMYGGQALAKKPVKPPPDPEPGAADVIYFEDVDAGLSSTPSDAREEPTSLAPPTGRISGSAHGGSRWVLYSAETGGLEPDGATARAQLFVEAAVVSGSVPIPLTVDGSIRPAWSTLPRLTFSWGATDDTVAFVGVEWADGVVADAGIYEIQLTWSSDGTSLTASSPLQIASCDWRVVGDGTVRTEYGDTISFAPGGSALTTNAYDTTAQDWVVVVVDLIDDTVTSLDAGCGQMAWSPDGMWIAAVVAYPTNTGDIVLVDPDGVDPTVTLLTSGNEGRLSWGYRTPIWSPDGSSLACVYEESRTSARLGRPPQISREIWTHDLATGDGDRVVASGPAALAWRP